MDGPLPLPGGEWVLFSIAPSVPSTGLAEGRWDSAQIVAHSLRTGEQKVLVQGGSDARYVDGHLVYAVGTGLFAVRFDAKAMRVTSGPVSIVEGVRRAFTTASANYGVSRNASFRSEVRTPADSSCRPGPESGLARSTAPLDRTRGSVAIVGAIGSAR